ncbi:MAG: type II toxin-antitoxin system HicB family antitoxin [Candidatus Micrarchaeota archaeon]
MKYSVILKEDKEDGGYVAIVPQLPGCISDGDTKEEAMKNIRDAIRLYVESVAEETRKFHALAKSGKGIRIESISL